MAETFLWIFLLAGWLALIFALGCLTDALTKRLNSPKKRDDAKSDQI
ncbi:MAG: hypothetical protein NC084_11145 [Bacteroides sp.]|nr:hypothetical protein [Eubacterium sp.]MCM1419398.1 hypothetical protein [Roseburia sp.]MCM1463246.1 hypothetical protein [Bacteroides sp.]